MSKILTREARYALETLGAPQIESVSRSSLRPYHAEKSVLVQSPKLTRTIRSCTFECADGAIDNDSELETPRTKFQFQSV